MASHTPRFQPCAKPRADPAVTAHDTDPKKVGRVVVPFPRPKPTWDNVSIRPKSSRPLYDCKATARNPNMSSLISRTVGKFRTAKKEPLRSRGSLPFDARGTVWKDPRFPLDGPDASSSTRGVAQAPNTHAGGNYYNALVSNAIHMSTDMRSGYVRGYGD